MRRNKLGLKVFFSSVVARLKRRTQVTKAQKGGNHLRQFLLGIVQTLKKGKVILLAFSVILLLVIGAIHIEQYRKIEPQRYADDTSQVGKLDGELQHNILLVGFDTKEEYRFATSIIVLSLNYQTSSLSALAVNPNYLVSIAPAKDYTLFSLWNNLGDNEQRMHNFVEQVELFVGIPIDRYVAFDISSLTNILQGFELGTPVLDNFKGAENFYTKGSRIEGNDLVTYLFAQTPTVDDLHATRQLEFLLNTIRSNRNLFFLSKAFWGGETLTNAFRTNMQKDEYVKFATELFSANEPFSTGVLTAALSHQSSEGSVNGIMPSYLDLDEYILKIFRDLNITSEQAKIEIYNASNKSGIATKYRRLFQNIGGTVINIGNYPESADENYLYVPRSDLEKFAWTVRYIEKVFDGKIKVVLGDYRYNYSGDLIIVIGSP